MFGNWVYNRLFRKKKLIFNYFVAFGIVACIVAILASSFLFPYDQSQANSVQINSVTPNSGPTSGGTNVTINGFGFLSFNQYNANLDTTFDPGSGANDTINAIALQPDGRILIGGWFTEYNGTPRNRIARLNSDGSLDTTFDPGSGADSAINAIALQPDGRILIGGNFTGYDGTPRNRIARLNSDGSLDTTFDPGSGANDTINAIALQPDDRILIGGRFTEYNGTPRNRIARLNSDGSLDTTFDPGSGANYIINTISLQPDDRILIGGWFTVYDGTPRNYIARLNSDGSLDTTFDPGSGADSTINAIALQPDDRILIGGRFTEYNGTPRNRIARLNSDGSLDTTFDPGSGANYIINTISLQPDDRILIGGWFTVYDGTPRNYIARLNSDGSLDTTFDPGSGADSTINAIALQPDDRILIGGGFTVYDGTPRNSIARLNSDGSLDTTFDPGSGANDTINAIALQPDDRILIGGGFTKYNGTPRNYIARLNSDGSLDTTFDPGSGANDIINAIALQPDGRILIGGWFTEYNGTPRNRIARLNSDGSLDTTFDPGSGADSTINAIALQPDDRILIGGGFTVYDGTPRNSIARLNSDGSLDTTFDPGSGANDTINAIALQPDGRILIGGWFTEYDGTPRNRIARLNSDGSLDTNFDPSSGADYEINTISLQPDGRILIGGGFNEYDGTPRNSIARLNSDGSLDTTFDPGSGANNIINAIALQPDGRILIGGWFTEYDGTPRNRIARLNSDGSLDTTFDPGSGANYIINAIALQPDGRILIGGWFTVYDGTPRNRIARIGELVSSNPPIVTIGDNPCVNVVLVSSTQITCTTPPGTVGPKNVVVVNGDGQTATLVNGFTYMEFSVTSIVPNSGPASGGTNVTINGAGFLSFNQYNANLDPTFDPGSGANGIINAIALQPDGRILISGSFTEYNGTPRNSIARLNPDGSLDTTFDPGSGANYEITAIALQPDGRILIGGAFTQYNATPRNRIVRLNSDGSLDTTFDPGSGANEQILAIALQPDGRILIGGYFTEYNGTPRNSIARLNSDGSLDTTFNPGSGANSPINTISPQPDGRILIGGWFTEYNGTPRNSIARLNPDGSLDTTFNPGSRANDTIIAIALQTDGRILIGGVFTEYNGTPRNYIARLNSDGSLDPTFDPGSGADYAIAAIALQSDGRILIGGFFTEYNGTPRNRIARLNSDGSLDTTFDPGSGANSIINAIALQPDGRILIGGWFTEYNGTPRNRIARIGEFIGTIPPVVTIDGNFCTTVVLVSSTQLTCTTPPGTVGPKNVTVVNGDGQTATLINGFTYMEFSVTSIVPNSGPASGGTNVTINGAGFLSFNQYNANLDPTFDPGSGANDPINAIALQPDGRILIGGYFNEYNGTPRNRIARLNSDGSLDTTFDPGSGANDTINAIALQPDGRILIGGWFTEYNGTPRNYIARLNSDGSLDTNFDPGSGADYEINTITLQPDGRILIGGYFTEYDGTPRNYIARLNSDGSLDPTFDPGSGANGTIDTISLQPDDRILIGGGFTEYNGTPRNYIARLNSDGSLDTNFDPGSGADYEINTITLQPDGRILIGGWFTEYDGTPRNYIARLNSDGSLDTNFDPGSGADSTINAIALQPDDRILIGGGFTEYDGTPRNSIARLNSDGSLDTTFDPGSGANNIINAITLQPDGRILIGGYFTEYNSTLKNRIARLNPDGSLDSTFDTSSGANGTINTISLQPDGRILIGGDFTEYDGTPRNRIARLNSDGSLDTTFDPGSGANGTIDTISLQPDGRILIGGWFTEYDGTPRNYIARLNSDGSLDTNFDPGSGADYAINTITLQPDGRILIGGWFNEYDGTPRNSIARLNSDGSLDPTFDPGSGADSTINAIALQPDGRILIGGNFTEYNGTPRNRIARLNPDGSLDTTFDPGSGANYIINAITLQPDGRILIGGDFTEYNGTPRNRIARLNPDGSLDTNFDPGSGANGSVETITLQMDGRILIAGGFTEYNYFFGRYLRRLNPNGSLDITFNPNLADFNGVNAIVVQPDGRILLGGTFTRYNNIARNRIARIGGFIGTTPPVVTIDGNFCTNVVLVSSTQLTCTTPPGTVGPKNVVLVNGDGQTATLVNGFTYTFSLSYIVPNVGPTTGGTNITINGSGFLPFNQYNANLDTTFDPGSGANSPINTISLQPDGRILIGGYFTEYDGTPRNYIARLNPDGSLDTTFDPGSGTNNGINAIALQPDGRILIGGWFTEYDGIPRNYIARLNPDGSLDTTFDPDSGTNYIIITISLQPDGRILIGGWFTEYDGTPRNRIARLNSDGSLDTNFDPGSGANDRIDTISLQPDGRILIGGWFTEYDGTPRNSIARLNSDGSLDTTFDPGSGANNIIKAIALQPDGRILIGGLFTGYDGTPRNRIARLNPDGSLDTTFDPGSGANGTINTISLQPDGRILIGGWFTEYNGTPRNRIARLNSDGSLDTTFDPGSGANSAINTITFQPDGRILIGGAFTEYNGTPRNYIARIGEFIGTTPPVVTIDGNFCTNVVLVSSTQLTCTTPPGTVGPKNVVVVNGDGQTATLVNGFTYIQITFQISSIIPNFGPTIGGTQVTITGSGFMPLTQYNADLDPTFDPGAGADWWITAMALQPDNRILIGGYFSTYDNVPRSRIARLNPDGSLDTTFNPGSGANNVVGTITLQPDGRIIIGGNFTEYNGVPINRIARLNPDGSLDTTFNPGWGANEIVYITALQPDGRILVGGNFTEFNGFTRNRIVRLNPDGSMDTTFNPGYGADSWIETIAIQQDGRILIGGEFWRYDNVGRAFIARLNPDGSLDTSFDIGTGASATVQNIKVQADGKIVIVGNFTTFNDIPRSRVARLNPDGSVDMSFNPGAGANGWVETTAIQNDGKIIIVGGFTTYDNVPRVRIARINPDGSLDTTFDQQESANEYIFNVLIQPDNKILIAGFFTEYRGVSRNRIARIGQIINTLPPIVTIDGNLCTNVVLVSDTELTCITPPGTVGPKDVVILNGNGFNGILPGGFTYYEIVMLCQTPRRVGETTTCELSSNIPFNNFSEPIEVRVLSATGSMTCSLPPNGNTMTCANVPLPGQIGAYQSQFRFVSSNQWFDGNIVNVIANIITEGLTLYYDAGHPGSYSGSGQDVFDLSGANRHGFLGSNNTPEATDPTWVNDQYKSFAFDGVDDFINTTLPSNFSSSFSLEVWFRRANNQSVTNQNLITIHHPDQGKISLGIEGQTVQGLVVDGSGGSSNFNSQFIPNTEWQMATLTYDASTSQLRIYLNGVLHTTQTVSLPNGVSETVKIGTYLNNLGVFSGNIAVVRAYNIIFNQAQIIQNFDQDKVRFGFVNPSVTVDGLPTVIDFGTLTVPETDQNFLANIGSISFVDRRQVFAPWTATIKISNLTSGSNLIAAENWSIITQNSTQTIVTGSGLYNQIASGGQFAGHNQPRLLFENLDLNGGGEFVINFDLSMLLPAYTRAGEYTGVVTIDIV